MSEARASRLPNAPLVEVVFELKWKLAGDDKIPPPFRQDPGYLPCLDSFIPAMKEFGFPEHKRIQPEASFMTPGYSIEYRFYRRADQGFPLIQIGPGLLAVNESSEYVWSEFKQRCLGATNRLLSSYPKLRTHPFLPIGLELRYVDAFKPSPSAGEDFLNFLSRSTNFNLSLPDHLTSGSYGAAKAGGINLTFPVKGNKDTNFVMVVSTGEVSGVQSIILQSSINTSLPPSGLGTSPKKAVARWLEDAHSCTSPFFKAFVKDSLLKHFKEPKRA